MVSSLRAKRRKGAHTTADAWPTLSLVRKAEEAVGGIAPARGTGCWLLHGPMDFAAYRNADQKRVPSALHALGDLASACNGPEMEQPETRTARYTTR